ncbi:MAG: 30S ribosomal protein S1 [Spirochaetaceae bacterium]|jgi:small subunit ribosomal protein S1|nr:30S ribosomal protein S1 [Spirochaetaceae bacterium]
MVIAIDGPAGAGKSAVAASIARTLGLVFLNSGSFYRAVTLAAQRRGLDAGQTGAVAALAGELSIDYVDSRIILDGEDVEDLLHTDGVDAQVSQVSAIPEVREAVNRRIRELTGRNPPFGKGEGGRAPLSVVCEGRDMTTVVFPDADFKFYLDASPDAQAERRFKQGTSGLSLEEIRESIRKRDELDKKKAFGALQIAPDAEYIDTSHLTLQEVCEILVGKITRQGLNMDQMEVENEESRTGEDIQTQLQEKYFKSFESLEEGQLVEGTVIQVTPEQVFVDVGYKSEGKIPLSEFTELPEIGDTVSVVLVSKENKNGELIVSKQKADVKHLWKNLRQAFQDKTPVEGVIVKTVKGGFDVDLTCGIHAFLPISQSDSQKVEKPESLLGLTCRFLIERLYSDNRANIVVNRRKFLEKAVEENRQKFFDTVAIGDTVKGTVKSFTSFGAFIDLGGFDGLLHINDMSWGHVTRPKDFVKKGQEIELKVIRLAPEDQRINLSLKHFTEDPWIHFEDKFHVGDVVKGKVTKLTDFGAFIELEDGIEGLAHISEFSWVKKVSKPGDLFKIGDSVECMVLGYDIQAGRVSLGLKQVTENPWDTIGDRYPVGMKLTRPVVKLTNAGAFVNLEEGIDAFLHADDISWIKKVRHPGSELTVGEEISALVVENNPEEHRIRLSIKHLTEDPWQSFVKQYPQGSVLEGEVVSVTDFGIFVRAPGGIEGLVNKANIVENREEQFEDAIKKYESGQKVNVYVLDVSPEKQKASFSVRECKRKQQQDELAQYMASGSEESADASTIGDLIKNRAN